MSVHHHFAFQFKHCSIIFYIVSDIVAHTSFDFFFIILSGGIYIPILTVLYFLEENVKSFCGIEFETIITMGLDVTHLLSAKEKMSGIKVFAIQFQFTIFSQSFQHLILQISELLRVGFYVQGQEFISFCDVSFGTSDALRDFYARAAILFACKVVE